VCVLVAVHCHAHRLDPFCYFPAADLYSIVYETAKAFHTIIEVLSCFTVTISLPNDASDNCTMKTEGRQLQRACKTRWLWSEATKSEILGVWAALKHMSENKNDTMCIVLLRLMKTKNLNMALSFVNVATSPGRTAEQSFSGGMF